MNYLRSMGSYIGSTVSNALSSTYNRMRYYFTGEFPVQPLQPLPESLLPFPFAERQNLISQNLRGRKLLEVDVDVEFMKSNGVIYTVPYNFLIPVTGRIKNKLIDLFIKDYFAFDEYDSKFTGNYEVTHTEEISGTSLKQIGTSALALAYKKYFQYELDPEQPEEHLNCNLQYILKEADRLQQPAHKKRLSSLISLQKEFSEMGIDIMKDSISPQQLGQWRDKYHDGLISINVLNMFFELTIENRVERPIMSLYFMSNNNHCYPIPSQMKFSVMKSKKCEFIVPITTRIEYRSFKLNDDDMNSLIQGTYYPEDAILFDHSAIDMNKLICQILEKTKLMPFGIEIVRDEISHFYHPISSQKIMIVKNYLDRLMVCNMLVKEHPVFQFKYFENKSYGQIGTDLFEALIGRPFMKSQYTTKDQELNVQYRTRGLIWANNPSEANKVDYKEKRDEYDLEKNYLYALLNLKHDTPTYTIVDSIEDFDGVMDAHRYLCRDIVWPYGVREEPQWQSAAYVQYAMDEGVLTKKDIILKHKASKVIDHTHFNNFAQYCINKFGLKVARNIIIEWIGLQGKNKNISRKSTITNSVEYRDAIINQYGHDKITQQRLDRMHTLIHYTRTKLQNEDNAPIMQAIICDAKIAVHQVMKKLYIPGISKILTVRIDGISGLNLAEPEPRDQQKHLYRHKKVCDLNPSEIKRLHPYKRGKMKDWTLLTDVHYQGVTKGRLDGVLCYKSQVDAYITTLLNTSMYVSGLGGTQKSELIKALKRLDPDNIHIVALSHRAISLLRDSLEESGCPITNMMVLKEYFYYIDKYDLRLKPRKLPKMLIVEECSQLGIEWYVELQKLKEQGVHILLFGDFHQTTQVSELDHYFDMPNKRLFRELCDYNRMDKQYYEDCCRSDARVIDLQMRLIRGEIINDLFPPIDPSLKINISNINKTKNEINNRLAVKWEPGVTITAVVSGKKNGIFNSLRYKIVSMDPFVVEYNGKQIETTMDLFSEGSCDTSYRWQGGKIEEPFNIICDGKLTANKLCSAVGRATNYDLIHAPFQGKVLYWETEPKNATLLKIRERQESLIYAMIYPDNKVYIDCKETDIYGDDYQLSIICKVYFYNDDDLEKAIKHLVLNESLFTNYESINKTDNKKKILVKESFRYKPKIVITKQSKEYILTIPGILSHDERMRSRAGNAIDILKKRAIDYLKQYHITDYEVELKN